MATPSDKITKTAFLNNYNIVEISNDINVIMKSLETFNPNSQAVMIGTKKQHTFSVEDRVAKLEESFLNIDEKLNTIINKLNDIETRLNNIVELNNLKE